MSTKNIPTPAPALATPTVELATEDQKGHILAVFKKRLEKMGLTNPQAQQIITNGNLFNPHVDRMLTNFFAEVFEEYWVTIDPTVPFEERIKRGGYDGVNSNITAANFKLRLKTPVRRKIVLYDPKNYVSSEEMVRRMAQNGDRRPTFDDVVAFGEQFPERQRKNPLPFLLEEDDLFQDSFGRLLVPVLDEWDDERKLVLYDWAGGWNGSYRFPAVREEVPLGS
jgi:hypothetical protein